nr:hypothetical protein [Tanacetum cinerariifolium]
KSTIYFCNVASHVKLAILTIMPFAKGTLPVQYLGLAYCSLAGMKSVPPRLEDIVDRLRPMAAKRTFKSIVGKLILAATTYFIWSERNNRLFKNVRRSLEELNDLIMVVVHLKLTTFRFKNKLEVMSMLAKWKLPNNFRIYGP